MPMNNADRRRLLADLRYWHQHLVNLAGAPREDLLVRMSVGTAKTVAQLLRDAAVELEKR